MAHIRLENGRKALVLGCGTSGAAAARFLHSRGWQTTIVDGASHPSGLKLFESDASKPRFVRSDFDASLIADGIDLLVLSPGLSPEFSKAAPLVTAAREQGAEVVGEIELFARELKRLESYRAYKPIVIGITGTNGKTSTTEMTSEMLTACGLTAPAVGNIGKAVSHAAVDPANDVLCVELSSFQLHFTYSLELDCAAITNIADDHLDWHGGIENYAADKAKVFHNVKKALVYNADDERVTKLAFAAQTAPECRRIGFTLAEPKDGQIGVKDGWIVDMSGIAGGEAGKPFQVAKVTDFTHLTEPDGTVYPHLLADALTALALVLGLGADKDKALAALKQFTPGGHRIQTVAVAKTSDGGAIRFVDDSKATNAHAAKASLNSFADKSVVWIAGGLAKGSRFEQLVADQAHTIKAAIIIGKDQQPMLDAFKASAPDIPMSIIDPTDNDTVMARAIDAAGTYAQSGDVVLMAPACASMDQFKSYADRGNQFAQQAQRWVNEHGEA